MLWKKQNGLAQNSYSSADITDITGRIKKMLFVKIAYLNTTFKLDFFQKFLGNSHTAKTNFNNNRVMQSKILYF